MADKRSAKGVHDADTGRLPTSAGLTAKQFAQIGDVEFTVGGEVGNAIAVTIQFKDMKDRNPDRRVPFKALVVDSSWNGVPTTTIEGFSVDTGVNVTEHVTDAFVEVITDATGKAVISLSETTGADTYYMMVIVGDMVYQSPVITFAA